MAGGPKVTHPLNHPLCLIPGQVWSYMDGWLCHIRSPEVRAFRLRNLGHPAAHRLVADPNTTFGEQLSARLDRSQCIQALLRGVVYNPYRLIWLRQILVPAS